MTFAAVTDNVDDDATQATGDSKKRSKLGYHRTAVACGHCRRRKIRCVPSSDIPEAKCQNCTRLKKECRFHPVDQQEILPKKARSHSKAESSLTDANTMQSSPSPLSSVEDPLSRVASSVGMASVPAAWERTGLNTGTTEQAPYDARPALTFPTRHTAHTYGIDQQNWTTPIPDNVSVQYSRHNSHPGLTSAQYYTPTMIASPMPYGQQHLVPITGVPTASPAPRPMYSDQNLEDVGYHERRQNFSPIGDGNGLQAIPSNQYAASYGSAERRSTLPVSYDGHFSMSAGTQVMLPYPSELGQHILQSQMPNHHNHEIPNSMYSQIGMYQNFPNLPNRTRTPQIENPRRYAKYSP